MGRRHDPTILLLLTPEQSVALRALLKEAPRSRRRWLSIRLRRALGLALLVGLVGLGGLAALHLDTLPDWAGWHLAEPNDATFNYGEQP